MKTYKTYTQMKKNNTKILSIDPGYGRMGFAILEKNASKINLLFSECVETDTNLTFNERLKVVISSLENHIEKYKPSSIALEKLFFAKNKKTAMQVAEVRGACIYTAQNAGVEIFEYHPNEIKKAITGNGNSNKQDIIRMLPNLLYIEKNIPMLDDEYDAISIGITHITSTEMDHLPRITYK